MKSIEAKGEKLPALYDWSKDGQGAGVYTVRMQGGQG